MFNRHQKPQQSSTQPQLTSFDSQKEFATSLYHKSALEPRKKNKTLRIVIALLLLCIAIATAWYAYDYTQPEDQIITSSYTDADLHKTRQEIVEALNNDAENNLMNIAITPRFVVDENLTGDIRMDNIAENHFDQKMALYDENHVCVYKSDFIHPGQGLREITLTKEPAPDTQKLIAVFTGYEQTDHTQVGVMSVEVTYVQEGAQS